MSVSDVVGTRRGLVLTAMIFAVAMTFIDQTIVSIAAPKIQSELGLTSTGIQWSINAYLLAMAALFAFGGRLADTVGTRRMAVTGIAVFAFASAMCGLTPKGSAAEGWLVAFRALQGAGGALMYPAALAIVVSTYEVGNRGKALALFFGIAGGLTAVGPSTGGYLVQWTWRAIFWINIPIAAIALILLVIADPPSERRPAPLDVRGLILVALGVGLTVFGIQQSAQWGWSNPAIGLSIAAGLVLLVVFARVEMRTESPIINFAIFRDRVFVADNAILAVAMVVFVPVFFFASEYAQISLGEKAAKASFVLLYFFAGFVVAAQIGGRMLDRIGARRPVVLGCALACVALILWANRVTTLSLGPQVWFIVLTGAGMGLMLGQANTDALNHAPPTAYGEATGITQTVRNFGSSLGLAVLGTILISGFKSDVETALRAQGLPPTQAQSTAAQIANLSHNSGTGDGTKIPDFVQLAFADATQVILYVMAAVIGFAGLIALGALPRRSRTRPRPEPTRGIEDDETQVPATA
jgi:EmrB/QacA subfamily drug resistance transporter